MLLKTEIYSAMILHSNGYQTFKAIVNTVTKIATVVHAILNHSNVKRTKNTYDDVAIDMHTCVIAHVHKITKHLLYMECTFCIKDYMQLSQITFNNSASKNELLQVNYIALPLAIQCWDGKLKSLAVFIDA